MGERVRVERMGSKVVRCVNGGNSSDLPLFQGPHIPRIRFERALARLDLSAAAAVAPEPQKGGGCGDGRGARAPPISASKQRWLAAMARATLALPTRATNSAASQRLELLGFHSHPAGAPHQVLHASPKHLRRAHSGSPPWR